MDQAPSLPVSSCRDMSSLLKRTTAELKVGARVLGRSCSGSVEDAGYGFKIECSRVLGMDYRFKLQ